MLAPALMVSGSKIGRRGHGHGWGTLARGPMLEVGKASQKAMENPPMEKTNPIPRTYIGVSSPTILLLLLAI